MSKQSNRVKKPKRYFDPMRSVSSFVSQFIARRPKLFSLLFLACFTAPSFAFLAPQTALSLNGFVIIIGMMMSDKRRRSLWEASVSFRLLDLKRKTNPVTEQQRAAPAPVLSSSQTVSAGTPRKRSAPLTANRKSFGDLVQDDNTGRTIVSARTVHPRRAPLTKVAPKATASAPAKPQQSEEAQQHFYSDSLIREFIQNAINKNRIKLIERPITRMPGGAAAIISLHAEIESYTDSYLPEDRYMPVAKAQGQVHKISGMILQRAIGMMRDAPKSDLIYAVPVYAGGLMDSHLMGRILDVAKHARSDLTRLAFHIDYAAFDDFSAREMQMMRNLTQLGVRFGLTDVTDMEPDIELLQKVGVKMIVMPAAFLAPMMDDTARFRRALQLRRGLEAATFRVAVGGIDTPATLMRFKGFAPRYAQGAMFSGQESVALRKAS